MKKITLFIITALITSLGFGQITEDFNYTTNDSLKTTGTGKPGWSHFSTSPALQGLYVNSNGLSYPNSPSSGIGFGVNVVAGQSVTAKSALMGHTNSNGAVAYMSFLINVSSLTGTSTNGFNFIGSMLGSIASTSGVSSRVLVRQNGTGFSFGIGKSAIALPNVAYESTVRNFNQTYLIVVKYTVTTTTTNNDDVVQLWVNPILGGAETTADLSTTLGTDAGSALIGPVINPRSTGAPSFEIDAIRAGLTWAYVTPITIPTLTVNPSTPLTIGAIPVNTTSPSVSFNLAGTFLTSAPGNITVTSPNSAFQVSSDNVTFSSSVNIPYSTATLAATPVYVRFSSVTAAAATVNLTISGGGVAVPPTVTVNASAATPFYSKPTGSLHVISTWGAATDGTGTQPTDFITDNQIFTITNRASFTLDDNFQVFGIGSKIVVGDGTNPTKIVLPPSFTILNDVDHKVDIKNNATLEIANKIYRNPSDLSKTPFPYFGTMDNNSTVEYSWNGNTTADTVRIPAETFGNLKLTNGLKYFSSGFAFANGTLNINDVVGMNGTGNGLASILVRGNVTMSNSFFDTDVTADANRLNLNLGGTGTQTLSGGDFYLSQLRTQAVSATVPSFPLNIVLGASTNMILGTTTAGGFNLQQPTHNLSLNGNTLTMGNGSSFLSTNQGTISGTSTSNLLINKTVGSAAIGSISFATGGQVLNDFTYNSSGTGTNNLTLNSPLAVNGILNLVGGNILIGNNTLTCAGTISGGSLASHILTNGTGSLKINAVGATTKTFPVGPSAALYHPATLNNSGTVDNFSVNVSSVAPPCGNPANSVTATWKITEETTGGSNCTISLDYNGATIGGTFSAGTAKVVDCNGSGPTYYGNGSVVGTIATGTGFTSFSPFGITSELAILPVTFINFSGNRYGNTNKLTWITSGEQNNLGFEVERSNDGQNFTNIAFVNTLAPGGNSTNNITYNYTDNKINAGTFQYYRLRQVDINNQAKYSDIVKINGEKVSVLTINGIAPNPVQNNLTASISSPGKNLVYVQVIDLMGRVLQTQQVNILEGINVFSVNVSSLSSGVYLLKAINVNGNQIPAMKFVKQ